MVLEKQRFRRYKEESNKEVYAIRLNDKEKKLLGQAQYLIQQPKHSTAIKQLFLIGLEKCLHDRSTALSLEILYNNLRKNDHLGIIKVEEKNQV